ncbi:MAG: sugar phosphate nucleotidyltransferase [Brevinema sp.]
MHALLLAGGKGTRLWPLSKKQTPKQLLSPLGDEKSLLEHTIDRTKNIGFDPHHIHLVTSEEQVTEISQVWNGLGLGSIIAEPIAQNTAPAILLAVKKLIKENIACDESIYVFPTDHYITDFKPNLTLNLKDIIFCYRIKPTRPEIEYGYMQAHTGGIIRKVRSFKEKPDINTAELWFDSWVKDPNGGEEEKYFWNAGIYAFTINSLKSALEKIDKTLYHLWYDSSYEEFLNLYNTLPKEPFDKLIAEKAYNLHCAPLPATSWRDIGSWESIHEALRSNINDTVTLGKGTVIHENTSSCLIFNDQEINVICGGLENLAIIIKNNNILIVDKNKPETIQKLIKKIQDQYPELME